MQVTYKDTEQSNYCKKPPIKTTNALDVIIPQRINVSRWISNMGENKYIYIYKNADSKCWFYVQCTYLSFSEKSKGGITFLLFIWTKKVQNIHLKMFDILSLIFQQIHDTLSCFQYMKRIGMMQKRKMNKVWQKNIYLTE